MARGRLLDKDISLSETVNALPKGLAFVYTWMIPYMDDEGYICKSPKKIKATMFPMKDDVSEKDISDTIEAGLKAKDQYGIALIEEYSDCLKLPGAFKRQSISKPTETKFQVKTPNSPKFPQIPPNFPEKPKATEQNITEQQHKGTKENLTEQKGKSGNDFSSLLVLLSVELGIKTKKATELIRAYQPDDIKKAITEAKKQKVRNPAGFIIKYLQEGWNKN